MTFNPLNQFHPDVISRIEKYTAGADSETIREVTEILEAAKASDPSAITEINEAFGRELDFGTGGLRGLMGPGTNRMNRVVIAKSTQGLAQYVASQRAGGSVAIAYDSRNNSKQFAQVAAQVVAGNGLTAYLFSDLRPTPQLSFAVRHLGATAGIVVTASHNPKEYSGYKVSWEDGAQVLPPHDKAIIDNVRAVESMEQVKLGDFDGAVQDGKIVLLGEEMDRAYLDALQAVRLRKDLSDSHGGELKIIYTPIHGTGIRVVPQALAQWGFSSVDIVAEQAEPDGDFPTTVSPNPEEHAALALALDLAKTNGADIVLATDPDADRLGFAVKHDGKYQLISGNQGCALMAWYICETLREQGRLPANAAIIKTIVTTELVRAITDDYGVHLGNCLTGFKYIAALMAEYEQPGPGGAPQKTFLMGCEESYGYLIGTHCRDKDAVVAACMVAEMALWAKTQGLTLVDLLHNLYMKYGVHIESQVSRTMPGLEGMKDINALMTRLREHPPKEVASIGVAQVTDILNNTVNNIATGQTEPGPGLPSSNVLIFNLTDGSKVVARPSGTEPKIKYYFMVVDRDTIPVSKETLEQDMAACTAKDKMLQDAWQTITSKFEAPIAKSRSPIYFGL